MDTLRFIFGLLPLFFCRLRVTVHGAATCGERLNAKDAGYITSPGYPHDYPSHQSCEWIIMAPEPNQKIVLNFNPHFEIEKHDCKYDFIEIRDGESEKADLLGKHCGNIAPAAIISSGPSLHIRFTSDYARQGAGFSLRYELFRTGSEDCSRNFTGSNGTIESPGFPDKYPHNLDCTFTILAKPKQEIVLQFLTFDLEHDPLQGGEGDCKYDWLDIWDGVPTVGPLIGRYCGTKTPSEIRSSSGILSLTFHTDMAVAKDGFSARYFLLAQETPEAFQCNVPLGMESGRIANEQITASSTYTDMRWTAQQSRLNSDDNGWTPNLDSNKEYLQVDLRFLTLLTAIATQGAISKETQKGYYVKSYKLEVSTNGEDWMIFRHGKNHKIFQGNTDPSEVVLNKIHQPVLTRFVRIRPQAWNSGIAMRIELYGCQITDFPCTNMMGMLSGLLSDAQITASSSRGYDWASGTARLVSSRSGWFPNVPNPAPGAEWLQVDLSVPKTVKGVIIQGARGGDTTENRAFVRKFKVAYSMSGKDWEYVQNSKKEQAKLFEGNMHYDTPEFRMFDPVPAQYVRVYPEKWSPAGVGMRLEVLGCDLMEVKPTSETMKPTITVEETTTQYPTDEYTTECGDSCGDNEGTQIPAAFNCSFDSVQGLCRWSEDTTVDGRWFLQSGTPSLDNSGSIPAESNQYLRLFTAGRREVETARIISPKVFSPKSGQCLVFWYQVVKGHGVALRVLRISNHENKLLWIIKEDQGHDWKKGKIMLPSYDQEYQIVIEGIIARGHLGEVTIDDIHIDNDISLDQCIAPLKSSPWVTSPSLQGGTHLPGSEPTVDTVSVQPIPTYWYYVMAAGGAVVVLVSVALALALHYHRFRYAAKKSEHAITYKPAHYSNGTPLAVEPTLTIKLEQDERYNSTHC